MTAPFIRLPLRFSAERLEADLRRIEPSQWVPHFNDGYYEGDWSGVALRALDGDASRIYPDPSANAIYASTETLDRCPYFREVIEAFRCPVGSARLLRLGPGSRIREHTDLDLGVEDGSIRLHIPVTTSERVTFVVGGYRATMRPGECWYFNASLPHRVDNRGDCDRVHLVLDCEVNDWLRGLLPLDVTEPFDDAVQPVDFAEFYRVVLRDLDLQRALVEISDKDRFFARTVELGRERGYDFDAADVESAFAASRRAWLERWI